MTPLALLSPPAPALDLTALPRGPIEALYVHVPFCFHKCHYCDFYSITRQSPERMEAFVDRVLGEARLWAGQYPPDLVRPRTVFFGGGTPSLLPLRTMRRLLAGLREAIDLTAVDEWTVECNPATVSADYLAMLREGGVDRLSFGAQSFNPADLKMLERHHDPDDVPRSVGLARAAGFGRVNVDLIYAVPGQTLEGWERSIIEALALRTEHVSAYGLTYESNTPLAVKKRLGQLEPVAESIELDMLRFARARLGAAGYGAYEISNYARDGEACRHNLAYWTGGSYLALGPAAASHVHGWRWRNRPHLGEWEAAVDRGDLPATEVEALTPDARAGELAMLMLRLTAGLDFDAFRARTGRDARELFARPICDLSRLGLVEATPETVRLTDRGLAVADAVAAEFLCAVGP